MASSAPSSSSSPSYISIGYLVNWRNSFRVFQGIIISIDYDPSVDRNCEVLVIYEINDCEVHTVPRRDFRVTIVRPSLSQYLDIVVRNYVSSHTSELTSQMLYSIKKAALQKIDESNDVVMTLAKSKVSPR